LKKVLAISKGIFHPTVFCRNRLKDILLSAVGISALEYTSDLNSLDRLETGRYQTVVLFFHEKEIAENLLNQLIQFVGKGGNLFCIHGSLASFKTNVEYRKLTGARFTGHDEIKDMNITGFADLTIRDELYEFDIEDDCEAKLECCGIPVFWTRRFGKGKVACLSPGHRTATFNNAGFKHLIKQILTDILGFNGG
jgi:type 1 glutamine amidotransferase